jgi:hypothetical protein
MDIESDLADFLSVVPPQGNNLKVWSPKLSTILVEACPLTESVFYHITEISAAVRVIDREHMGLEEYAELHGVQRRLAERKVVFFQEPLRWIEPFRKWVGRTTRLKVPTWWAIYNRAKHQRLDTLQEATLETAIVAVAGVLVTIVTEPALLIAAGRHEWLDLHAEGLEGFVADFFQEKSPFIWLCPETQLFAAPLGPSVLPDNIDELRHPGKQLSILGGGQRFKRWLGIW